MLALLICAVRLKDRMWPCAACPVNPVVRAKQERFAGWQAKRLSREVGISTFDLHIGRASTDQKIHAPPHLVGQAGRSLHFSRIKQFARSVGVSFPMQLFSHCSLHSSWVPPEPLNSCGVRLVVCDPPAFSRERYRLLVLYSEACAVNMGMFISHLPFHHDQSTATSLSQERELVTTTRT
jgi:hypothetical protein